MSSFLDTSWHGAIGVRNRVSNQNLKQILQDYYSHTITVAPIAKTLATAAEVKGNEKLSPFNLGRNFFGSDYDSNKIRNASYIDLPRIYATQTSFPSLLFM
uniref:N-acetylmuramoyl-L-alanine amidase n=1 Tax=Loa loa TaxID=7209 RepID=A0A1I7VLA0_LOALO